MYHLIFFWLFLVTTVFTSSQKLLGQVNSSILVTGEVIDEKNAPLPGASIVLYYDQSPRIQATGVADMNGLFELTSLKGKEFNDGILVTRFLGYKSDTISFRPDSTIQLSIQLIPSSSSLKEVLVSASRFGVKVENDTIAYDIAYFSKDSVEYLEDIIRRLPGLTIDEDGNINYQGESIDRVLLDGDSFISDRRKSLISSIQAKDTENIKLKFRPNDGIDGNERVDLDISLKKNRQGSLFGTIAGSIGSDNLRPGHQFKGHLIYSGKYKLYSNIKRFTVGNPELTLIDYLNNLGGSKPIKGMQVPSLYLRGGIPMDYDFTVFSIDYSLGSTKNNNLQLHLSGANSTIEQLQTNNVFSNEQLLLSRKYIGLQKALTTNLATKYIKTIRGRTFEAYINWVYQSSSIVDSSNVISPNISSSVLSTSNKKISNNILDFGLDYLGEFSSRTEKIKVNVHLDEAPNHWYQSRTFTQPIPFVNFLYGIDTTTYSEQYRVTSQTLSADLDFSFAHDENVYGVNFYAADESRKFNLDRPSLDNVYEGIGNRYVWGKGYYKFNNVGSRPGASIESFGGLIYTGNLSPLIGMKYIHEASRNRRLTINLNSNVQFRLQEGLNSTINYITDLSGSIDAVAPVLNQRRNEAQILYSRFNASKGRSLFFRFLLLNKDGIVYFPDTSGGLLINQVVPIKNQNLVYLLSNYKKNYTKYRSINLKFSYSHSFYKARDNVVNTTFSNHSSDVSMNYAFVYKSVQLEFVSKLTSRFSTSAANLINGVLKLNFRKLHNSHLFEGSLGAVAFRFSETSRLFPVGKLVYKHFFKSSPWVFTFQSASIVQDITDIPLSFRYSQNQLLTSEISTPNFALLAGFEFNF